MALMQDDIKKVLAYSSISQMGYILFGLGSESILGITGSYPDVCHTWSGKRNLVYDGWIDYPPDRNKKYVKVRRTGWKDALHRSNSDDRWTDDHWHSTDERLYVRVDSI